MVFFVADAEATESFGACLYQVMAPGVVIYLEGQLGAGKTTLVRGFLKKAGFSGSIKSPTYTLVETYKLPPFAVTHFDLYRLQDPEELEWLGFRDYLQGESVCFVEWPEKGQGFLPPPDLVIQIEYQVQGRRCFLIAESDTGNAILERLKTALKTRN